MNSDWKLTLMKVLDVVGNVEGIRFSPWDGVSQEDYEEIVREYETYKLDERPGFYINKCEIK